MTVLKNYRVSEDFDKRLHDLKTHLKDNCGLDYTIAEILDEMKNLYVAKTTLSSGVLDDLIRENDEILLNEILCVNAEMINSVKDMIVEAIR